MQVSKTGSYYIYGGLILFVLMCCTIVIIVCTSLKYRSIERNKSIALENELQKSKAVEGESKRDATALDTNANMMTQEESM